MNGCSSVSYESYSDKAVATSYDTPQWAYMNVTGDGFDLTAVETGKLLCLIMPATLTGELAAGVTTNDTSSKQG